MSAFSQAKRDRAIADETIGASMACSVCSRATPAPILNQYGARCSACYDRYCLETGPSGFMAGRQDTPTQAEMRRGVRT